jgi:predicted DsbA family dithiol-disulfide isomerase
MEQSSLVKLQANYACEVNWRGFELHPETPIGGIAVAALFPGRPIEKIRARMQDFAREFGVDMVIPAHLANTRRALAISEYARDKSALDSFRQEATRAYWVDGRDLENDDDLHHIAEAAGLDPAEALAASHDALYLQRVQDTRDEGMDRMVTGVPTLFFKGMPVVGCQPYETIEKVAKLAGLPPRS